MDLANDTCGLIKANFYHLHAYLAGGVQGWICINQVLSYHFWKTLSSSNYLSGHTGVAPGAPRGFYFSGVAPGFTGATPGSTAVTPGFLSMITLEPTRCWWYHGHTGVTPVAHSPFGSMETPESHQAPYHHCLAHQILFNKLEWWDSWTASMSSRSQLSVTGDTAMIIVLTLSRGCALSPRDSINPFCP